MSERAEASGSTFWGDPADGEALQRYRALVNAVDDGIYQLDAEGRFVGVNDAVTDITGYEHDRLLGKRASFILDPDDYSTLEREVERRLGESGEGDGAPTDERDGSSQFGEQDGLPSGESETFAVAVRTADGDRVPCELRLNLLVEDGAFRGVVGVVREETGESRRAREGGPRERASELERYEAIVEAVEDGVYVVDADGQFTMVNEAYAELTGYSREELLGEHVSLVVDEDVRRRAERTEATMRDGEAENPMIEAELKTASGDRVPTEATFAMLPGSDGERRIGVVRDVSERKRLESELDEIFGRVTDAFYALDDEWRITHANERAEDLIDYEDEGLVGRNFWEVFGWATDSTLGEEYRTAMETQESTSFEFYYPDPLDAWYEVHAYPSETGLSVYFRDVTERKERQRDLEESERRYRTLVEHFPNGAVALVDEDLRYRTIGGDPAGGAVTAEALDGRSVRDGLPSAVADELVPGYEAALDGESTAFESEVGGRTYQFHFVPVRDDDGTVFAAFGMSQDVTERTEYERKLAESERRYRTLAEYFPNGIVTLFDHDFEYTLAAGRGFEGIPVDPGDLEGNHFREAWDEDTADALAPAFRSALDGEERSVELEYHGREWVLHAVPITDERGDVFAGMTMAQDITDQKERERQLRRYREYTGAVLDAIDDVLYILDESGDLKRWNDSLCEVTGYRDDEVESMHALAFFGEEFHREIADAIREGFETGSVQVEADIATKTGERVPFEFVASALEDPEGNRVLAGIGRDVTRRKERERQLEETVEKLEASNDRLESFASMLAHELRNPVTIGQIYSQQLPGAGGSAGADPEASEGSSDAVEYVVEAFDRMEDIIDVMLVLTRGREAVGERSPVPISDVVRDAWDEVEAPDATLAVDLDGVMRADETYVRHLFRNLFENAVEHGSTSNRTESGDTVEHGSTSSRPQGDDAVEHGGPDVTVRVGASADGFYVADDGPGIPADEREAVFEAGFTTAGDEGGTGLGLAFVEKLADVYDWECEVTESWAGGARFEFRNVDLEPAE